MKHKVYTTYLAKIKKIPSTCKTVLIMRFPPFIPDDSDVFHAIDLSPSGKLLMEYKENHDFESFKDKLWNEWNNNPKSLELLKQAEEALDLYNDICFVCCEKDLNICHRKILGEYFEFLGYEWEELK